MRYLLLDTLRGFSLVSMILYHICWDLVHMYGFDWPWFMKTQGYLWQQSICWLFIFVSGFCQGLKRDERTLSSACKRGLVIMVSGLLVTAATLVFAPEAKIIFGVLFFLGFSINEGNLGFETIILCRLPDFLYEHGLLGSFLGLQDKNFSSADYFSFIPWYFLFIKGYFICRNLLQKRETKGLSGLPAVFTKGIPVLETLGQHSLLVYLLHQPVILLILSLVFKPAL